MGCLCIYHPDIFEFLESKSWDEGKLTHFNLSVLVDDDFMNAVKEDKIILLRYPCMNEKGEIIKDESQWKIKEEVKAKELWDLIMTKAYNTGEYGVLYYDNMNRDNNLYYMEKIVTTNPCGEYLSGLLTINGEVKDDHFGACNLGSLFLHNFVEHPFEDNAGINCNDLTQAIRTGVRMLDNIIDINNYPLDNYRNYQTNIRTIGLGITGLADLLAMLKLEYGSKESLALIDKLMNLIVYTAYDESCELAKEKGEFNYLDREKFVESEFIKKHIAKDSKWENIKNKILKNGIRNARLISVAPTGTLSLTYGNNCSSGLEPIFSLEYDRKVKVGGQDDENITIFKMRDYAYELYKNSNIELDESSVFKTAMELSVNAHLDVLSVIANHTDMSCSKTINIPTDYPFEDTKEVYMKCWERGIKGCTIFRPNEIREGILTTDTKEVVEKQELKRGEWSAKPKDTIYVEKKIKTGCGKLKLFVGISLSENRLVDMYVKRVANGGCVHNIDALVISMSSILRLGGSLCNIEKAFRGCGVCNSFTKARSQGKEVSKGVSCPTAILNAIKEVEDEYLNKENQTVIKKEKVEVNLDKSNKLNEDDKNYIKEYGESTFAQRYNKCPECGNEISHTGGCIICNNCSWTKCE